MKSVILILVLLTFTHAKQVTKMQSRSYTYLALGDSYTIGEQVPLSKNFPSQTVELLRKNGYDFGAPEIVARTGWTTDELELAINNHSFDKEYDFVTLLIGVNNQYRGRSSSEYEDQFETLLEQAIQFAGNDSDHVAVLSIPDWGVTPFANGGDRKQIAKEIDAFNTVNRQIARKYHIHYIDITPFTREAAHDPSLLAPDGLHPSAKEYKRWAEIISAWIKSKI
jgi:lysophospholipase L1-like esterase